MFQRRKAIERGFKIVTLEKLYLTVVCLILNKYGGVNKAFKDKFFIVFEMMN